MHVFIWCKQVSFPSRKSWCWSWCCCCLNWPVTLTACLIAADNRLAPVASTCCCAAPEASPWGDLSLEMLLPASSPWANGRRKSIACTADSTTSCRSPGTRRQGSWLWGRGQRRGPESRSWTGWLGQEPPSQPPSLCEGILIPHCINILGHCSNVGSKITLILWVVFNKNVYFFAHGETWIFECDMICICL